MIAAIIRLLEEALGIKPKNERDQYRHATSHQDDAQHERLIRTVNALTEEYKSSDQQRKEHEEEILSIDKKRLRVEKIAMGAAVLAAVGTVIALLFVWRSTNAAVDAVKVANDTLAMTEANFWKDQQPYVLIHNITPESKLEVGQIAYWRVEFRNYGKSPAVNARARGKVFVGKNTSVIARTFLNGLPSRLSGGPVFMVNPNTTDSEYTSARTDAPLTIDQHQLIPKGDFTLIVVGRFQYEDIAGNIYESDFCHGTLQTGRIATCPEFNTIRQVHSVQTTAKKGQPESQPQK